MRNHLQVQKIRVLVSLFILLWSLPILQMFNFGGLNKWQGLVIVGLKENGDSKVEKSKCKNNTFSYKKAEPTNTCVINIVLTCNMPCSISIYT